MGVKTMVKQQNKQPWNNELGHCLYKSCVLVVARKCSDVDAGNMEKTRVPSD